MGAQMLATDIRYNSKMSARLKVLHLLHTSLPYVCGYSLRSAKILEIQRSLGFDVQVVTSAQQPDAAMDETIQGITHFRVQRPNLLPTPAREIQLIRAMLKRTIEVAARFHPDVIHAHSPILVGFPGLFVSKRLSKPFVYEVRDLWENATVDRKRFGHGTVWYRAARSLETMLVRRADCVVTIGNVLRKELEGRTDKPVFVVQNGVDVEQFSTRPVAPIEPNKWQLTDSKLIAYVGSFQPYEGLGALLESFALVLRSQPSTRLLIAGDGPEKAGLVALAAKLQIQDAVNFAGRVPHSEVSAIYSAADVLVYPRIDTLTTRLTTPLKPLEALAMGRAVVASDLPAMRELIVDGSTGLLFRAGDATDLSGKILQILSDSSLRALLGRNGRSFVVDQRQWKDSVKTYQRVYDEAIKARKR